MSCKGYSRTKLWFWSVLSMAGLSCSALCLFADSILDHDSLRKATYIPTNNCLQYDQTLKDKETQQTNRTACVCCTDPSSPYMYSGGRAGMRQDDNMSLALRLSLCVARCPLRIMTCRICSVFVVRGLNLLYLLSVDSLMCCKHSVAVGFFCSFCTCSSFISSQYSQLTSVSLWHCMAPRPENKLA